MSVWQWAVPEWGQTAFMLAMAVMALQALLLSWATPRLHGAWMGAARRLPLLVFVLLSVSVLALVYCFVKNDFAVIYVAEHSNQHLPLFYRLTGFWGAHEGSVLLWVWMLGVWQWALSRSQRIPLRPLSGMLAVMAWILLGFAVFLLLTSNPFSIGMPPYVKDGADMNPLLQDPGFVIHPPILYAGYVGFAVPFAFAVTVLLQKIPGREWADWLRPWALSAWGFLSLGIVLGSWWSYRQLGWGGWWFWDPVENASLMPWLIGTALLHGLLAVSKRGVLKGFSICLALLAFILSVMGTFLVRSGVLISVHAFAVDPSRGRYLLIFLFSVVFLAYGLYMWRSRHLHDARPLYACSRESALMLNMTLLLAAMATVLLGTLYPLVLQVLGMGKISVGLPYFNAVFVPIMLPLLFAMGWVPDVAWRHDQWRRLFKASTWILLLSMLIAVCLVVVDHWLWWAALGLALSLWIVLNTASYAWRNHRQWSGWRGGCQSLAMVAAHIGMAVLVMGVVLVSSQSHSLDLSMRVGDGIDLGAYHFVLQDVYGIKGPNYVGDRADIAVFKHRYALPVLHPEIRMYVASQMANPKADTDVNPWRDVYAALAQPLGKNRWAVRLYIKPFVRWIWLGGILMALGALLACLGRDDKERQCLD